MSSMSDLSCRLDDREFTMTPREGSVIVYRNIKQPLPRRLILIFSLELMITSKRLSVFCQIWATQRQTMLTAFNIINTMPEWTTY